MFVKYRGIVCGIIAAAVVFVGSASAEEKEPVAVLELGGAAAWNMPGGTALGPTASVEFEPIKDNLLIEAGITPFFDNSGHADWDFDLVFRHPFELSKKVEFEPGIGPSLSSSGQIGAVASFEFMIWPWQERKYGWFIDPSYSVSFAPGHQQSFGLALGVLYGFQ
jgi:hypothetical protein